MRNESTIFELICASEGISVNSKEISNFNELLDVVDLGPIFEELCLDEGWDQAFVKESLIKYVLHQIKQESVSLDIQEKGEVEDLGSHKIDNIELGVILAETHFIDPKDYFETFGDQTLNLFNFKDVTNKENISNLIFGENIPYEHDYDEFKKNSGVQFGELWHQYSRKSGSSFHLYNKFGVIREKKLFEHHSINFQ